MFEVFTVVYDPGGTRFLLFDIHLAFDKALGFLFGETVTFHKTLKLDVFWGVDNY